MDHMVPNKEMTMTIKPKNTNQPKTPDYKFIYVVRADKKFVGSPTDTRTSNPNLAASWTDETEALAVAHSVGGVVATRQIEVPAAVEPAAQADMSPLAVAPKAPRAPKAPKGIDRDSVLALLKATTLPLQEKSSSHYGDPKGVRLVLPRSAAVTKLYVYKLDDSSLPGYHTLEERKAQGLGAVTHVVEVHNLKDVTRTISAVVKAQGPTKSSRRASKNSKVETKAETPVIAETTGENEGGNQ